MCPGFHRRLNVLPRGERGGVLVFRHRLRNFALRQPGRTWVFQPN
jgi:hypothetical protein